MKKKATAKTTFYNKVKFTVTQKQKATLKRDAKAHKMNVAEYVRFACGL